MGRRVLQVSRLHDRSIGAIVAGVGKHLEPPVHTPAQSVEPVRRCAPEPLVADRQRPRVAQHPHERHRIEIGVGHRRRRGDARLGVDPIALEPEQTARAEVDDVALEVLAVPDQVELLHVLRTERHRELDGRRVGDLACELLNGAAVPLATLGAGRVVAGYGAGTAGLCWAASKTPLERGGRGFSVTNGLLLPR